MNGDCKERYIKVLLSITLILITYLFAIHLTTSFRVRPDEWNFVVDVVTAHKTGYLGEKYINGRLYQAGAATILLVLGKSVDALDWLSPFIAAVTLSMIVAIVSFLFRRFNADWWSILVFAPVVLVFPNFLSRIRESSHKVFTMAFFFLALWFLIRLYYPPRDRRDNLILIGIIGIFPLLNYIWAAIFAGGLLFTTQLSKKLASIDHRMSWQPHFSIYDFLIPGGFVYLVMFFLPGINLTPHYFSLLLINAAASIRQMGQGDFSFVLAGASGGQTAGEAIGTWPIASVGPVSISTWYIFGIGIFIAVTLTVLTLTVFLVQLLRTRDPLHPVVALCSGVIVWYGLFAGLVVAGGNVGGIKRLVSVPGILGILLWAAILAAPGATQAPNWVAKYRRQIAVITTIMLLVSAPLALGRAVTNGEGNPYDTYITGNEQAELAWIKSHSGTDKQSLSTYQVKDHYAALQVNHRAICPKQPHRYDPIVYHSGGKGHVVYDDQAAPTNFESRKSCLQYNDSSNVEVF